MKIRKINIIIFNLWNLNFRYIEAFVRQKPLLPVEHLPTKGQFTRQHVVVGLFTRICAILGKYSRENFNSSYYFLYPLCGLCKNARLLQKDVANVESLLIGFMEKFQLTPQEKNQLFTNLLNEDDV